MPFKLGSTRKGFNIPNNIEIKKSPLESDTIAEARNDGTIVINSEKNVTGNALKRAIKHEMKHMCDMAQGRADYGDNWVMWEDKIYIRKNGMIDGPNGRWPEGDEHHPWEAEAIAAEE